WFCFSSRLIRTTEPVRSLFFIIPYPTTTSSSSALVSETKRISSTDSLPTATSWDINPTKEKTKMGFSCVRLSVYFPLISVVVPCWVPLTNILTPGSASPFSSETVPVTVLSTFIPAQDGRVEVNKNRVQTKYRTDLQIGLSSRARL